VRTKETDHFLFYITTAQPTIELDLPYLHTFADRSSEKPQKISVCKCFQEWRNGNKCFKMHCHLNNYLIYAPFYPNTRQLSQLPLADTCTEQVNDNFGLFRFDLSLLYEGAFLNVLCFVFYTTEKFSVKKNTTYILYFVQYVRCEVWT
jgi:hypothetical protein